MTTTPTTTTARETVATGRAFRTAIGTEFLKLATIRSPLGLLVLAVAVVTAGVSGLFLSSPAADPRQYTQQALAHAGLVSFLSLVLGILTVAGEYRHRSISDTYLSTPRRGAVIRAKLVVSTITGLGVGVVSSAAAVGVTAIWLDVRGSSLDLTSATVGPTLAGCIVMNAAFAAIGVGVGALIRNLTAAVAVALAWLAVVEGIVGQLIGGLDRWLPFTSGLALEGGSIPGKDLLAPVAAGLVLAGYAALAAVVSIWTTVRRDVT